MTTNTTHPGDRDPHADPADEWDREVSPGQQLATAMRTAVAAKRDLDILDKTSVYIAGPMSTIPKFNFPAFQAAAVELRAMGLGVRHTAKGNPPTPAKALPWDHYLRDALRVMLDADAVVVLPGWRESKGARLEVHVALELGMPVVEYPDLRPVEIMGLRIPEGTAPTWDEVKPYLYPASRGGLTIPVHQPEGPKGMDASHMPWAGVAPWNGPTP